MKLRLFSELSHHTVMMANMLKGLCMFSIQRYSIQIRFKERSFMSFLNRIWVAGGGGNYCVYVREYPYCVS